MLQAISRLLDMLLLNLSADVQHVVECVTGGQSRSALAVLWRVRGGQSDLLHAKVHAMLSSAVVCSDGCANDCKVLKCTGIRAFWKPVYLCTTGHHLHEGQQPGPDLLHT